MGSFHSVQNPQSDDATHDDLPLEILLLQTILYLLNDLRSESPRRRRRRYHFRKASHERFQYPHREFPRQTTYVSIGNNQVQRACARDQNPSRNGRMRGSDVSTPRGRTHSRHSAHAHVPLLSEAGPRPKSNDDNDGRSRGQRRVGSDDLWRDLGG